MITVSFIGRKCNCLFQYVFARILAEKTGMKLCTEWNHSELLQFTQPKEGIVNTYQIKIDDTFKRPTDLNMLENTYKTGVQLRGYFQHHCFYDGRLEQIKSWMILPAIESGHESDLCLHVRLDDYLKMTGQPIIHYEWYKNIVEMPENKGKRIYIIVDTLTKSWEREYMDNLLNALQHRSPTVQTGIATHDFHFMRSFGTIVCSNSSFAWWAARLSNAKKIYTFMPWLSRGCPYVRLAQAEGMTAIEGSYLN